MSPDDDLYYDFVERLSAGEDAAIPTSWPAELQDRCRFFRDLVAGLSRGSAGDTVASALDSEPPAAHSDAKAPVAGRERYVIEREIASGGMGRILLCYDRDIRRHVAMKVVKSASASERDEARFREEAQATAQLEHPNINPVYDVGVDRAGEPYFTMKWIRGRNLDEVLKASEPELSAIRRVQILEQAAMAVDFAHSRGVVHRDLKPQNVMLGDFGEVLVVDWGLAKVLGTQDDGDEGVTTSREADAVASLRGTVKGSLQYMAPEQASGDPDAVDARTDVFGLGAILYVMLTGRAPYEGRSTREILALAKRAEIVPPGAAAPGRIVPPALEAICLKALARRPEERFQSARELHDALQRFVEGTYEEERRQREAARLLEEARAKRADLDAAEAEVRRLAAEEDALRAAVRSHDPPETKRPLWDAVGRRRSAEEEAAGRLSAAVSAYHAVLSVAPGDSAAREGIAEIYFARLGEAEARGDADSSRVYASVVRQYGVARFEALLDPREELRLDSLPQGAAVRLSRCEPQGIELREGPPADAGATPLVIHLPMGSYVATLVKPGFEPVRLPLLIERGHGVEARARLPRQGSIPSGFVQVAGGPTILGGDPRQGAARTRCRKVLPEHFIGRFPVTLGEYCAFLDERLGGAGAPEEKALLHQLLPAFETQQFVERGSGGRFGPHAKLSADTPVMALFPAAMKEYCAWAAHKTGLPLRLPSEDEWERSARGADGRLYPWGNELDWSLCRGGLSVAGIPRPGPVGAFAGDVSPFGVRDMAGTIRELCEREGDEPYHPVRGGSWYITIPAVYRSDSRTLLSPGAKTTDVGFRLAFRPEPGD